MSYPGAKDGAGVFQAIINQQPPHGCYVEPFLGGGSVMRRKRPAPTNIGCDLDPRAIEAARARIVPGGERSTIADVGTAGNGETVPLFFFHAMDGIDYLRRGAHPASDLVYCDPPYLMSSRRQHRRLYRCELSRARHVELGEVVHRLRCMVQVSGYRSELYDRLYRAWRRVDVQTRTHGGPALESIWMNYPVPVRLHDYRYLGADYRERERIHRQQRRWAARLASMPALERLAMLDGLRDGAR